MSHEHHKAHAPRTVRVYVLTVSDTRTEANDTGGQLCRELVRQAGHEVAGSAIVPDNPALVQRRMLEVIEDHLADVIISTGGTGISGRDNTYEAVAGILEKRLDGFGELFRMLSYQDIGSSAMLSRALGGVREGVAIFALPGAEKAVRLGMEKLIVPELGHLLFETTR